MTTINELIGAVDNLDEPRGLLNHKATIYGLVITSLIITSICVCMRLYIRFHVTRRPGFDDYFILVAWIVAWAANISCCLLANAGLGEHFILLGQIGMSNFARNFWWCNACYNTALALVKLSLLFQYLRLLEDHPEIRQPKLRKTIGILIIIVSLWGIAWSVLSWIPCSPISAQWDFSDAPALRWAYGSRKVTELIYTFYNHASSNMVLDIIIISLPMVSRSLWATAMTQKKTQIGMLGLFCLGGLSVLCSIIRFAYIVKSRANTWPVFDPSWYGARTTVLSVMEVDLATIVGSLPVFWPHLRRNIASIMVTHEFEVKVTRESELFGTSSTRDLTWTGTHWDVETGGHGPRARNETIVLRDISITSTNTDEALSMTDSKKPIRSNSRLARMGRESKEVLLE